MLIDQNPTELEAVRDQVHQKTNAKIETYQFDFANTADYQSYETLCKEIQEKVGADNISMLVNNVEELEPFKGKLHKRSDEKIAQTLNTNIFPMTFMSRFLGPNLKSRMQGNENHSAIISMTSYYSTYPVSNMPLYSSCKSFNDVVSQCMWYEN